MGEEGRWVRRGVWVRGERGTDLRVGTVARPADEEGRGPVSGWMGGGEVGGWRGGGWVGGWMREEGGEERWVGEGKRAGLEDQPPFGGSGGAASGREGEWRALQAQAVGWVGGWELEA